MDNMALVCECKSGWKLLSSGSIRSADSLCKITVLRQLTAALMNPGERHHMEGARQPNPHVAVLSVSYPACLPRWLRGFHSHRLFVYFGVSNFCYGIKIFNPKLTLF